MRNVRIVGPTHASNAGYLLILWCAEMTPKPLCQLASNCQLKASLHFGERSQSHLRHMLHLKESGDLLARSSLREMG